MFGRIFGLVEHLCPAEEAIQDHGPVAELLGNVFYIAAEESVAKTHKRIRIRVIKISHVGAAGK
jgi:hypothetical protein